MIYMLTCGHNYSGCFYFCKKFKFYKIWNKYYLVMWHKADSALPSAAGTPMPEVTFLPGSEFHLPAATAFHSQFHQTEMQESIQLSAPLLTSWLNQWPIPSSVPGTIIPTAQERWRMATSVLGTFQIRSSSPAEPTTTSSSTACTTWFKPTGTWVPQRVQCLEEFSYLFI